MDIFIAAVIGFVTALVELPTLIGTYLALCREVDELYRSYPDKYALVKAKLWGAHLKSSAENLYEFISNKLTEEERGYASVDDIFSDSSLNNTLFNFLDELGKAHRFYAKSISLKEDRKSSLETRNTCFLHFSILLLSSTSIMAVYFIVGEIVIIILCGAAFLAFILFLRLTLAWRNASSEKEWDMNLHDLATSFQIEGDSD